MILTALLITVVWFVFGGFGAIALVGYLLGGAFGAVIGVVALHALLWTIWRVFYNDI
jgi:hypothetical protein